MRFRRGLSLATVLMVMGLGLSGLFLNNLNLMQASNNGEIAQREAESGSGFTPERRP